MKSKVMNIISRYFHHHRYNGGEERRESGTWRR
jgi:hypothetical protein